MRGYGLGYAQADCIIRHYTLLHWRCYAWIGGMALGLLVVYVGSTFVGPDLGAVRGLLLVGGTFGAGLQLWLAQRAAYPAIQRAADELRHDREQRAR